MDFMVSYYMTSYSLQSFKSINKSFYEKSQFPGGYKTFEYLLTPQWWLLLKNNELTVTHLEQCLQYIKKTTAKSELSQCGALCLAITWLSSQSQDYLNTLTAKQRKTVIAIIKESSSLPETDIAFLYQWNFNSLSPGERFHLFLYNHHFMITDTNVLEAIFMERDTLLKKNTLEKSVLLPWSQMPSFPQFLEYCFTQEKINILQHIPSSTFELHKKQIITLWDTTGFFGKNYKKDIDVIYIEYINEMKPQIPHLVNLMNSIYHAKQRENVLNAIIDLYPLQDVIQCISEIGYSCDKDILKHLSQKMQTASNEAILAILHNTNTNVELNGICFQKLSWEFHDIVASALTKRIENQLATPYRDTIRAIKATLNSIGQRASKVLVKKMLIQQIQPTSEIDVHF